MKREKKQLGLAGRLGQAVGRCHREHPCSCPQGAEVGEPCDLVKLADEATEDACARLDDAATQVEPVRLQLRGVIGPLLEELALSALQRSARLGPPPEARFPTTVDLYAYTQGRGHALANFMGQQQTGGHP